MVGGPGHMGPTATQASAAAGLPFAGVPTEMQQGADRLLELEPDHPEPEVDFDHVSERADREPARTFGLRDMLIPHSWGVSGALLLLCGETAAMQTVPVLFQQGIDRGISAGDRFALNMVVPIVVLVAMMPVGLWITGNGDLAAGNGSTSVLWASLAALTVAWILLLFQKAYSLDELTRIALRGAGGLVPLAVILLLALALGSVTRTLGTGDYVAAVVQGTLAPGVFLPLVFVVASAIAFSIGSSWGTFAIMIPIIVPAAGGLGLDLAPFLAAALSGGIFGDHCSPISDTTIISSMAAATDHVDHVRTQLPYALAGGAVATVCFALAGAFL